MPTMIEQFKHGWIATSQRIASPIVRRILAGLLVAWLGLAALTWLAGPALLRWALTQQVGQALQRDVSIQGVTINPLNGALEVEGFSVKSPGGHEQIGFTKLRINLSSLSIAQGGIVVDELLLQAPRVAIARLGEGQYDISDWLDRWLQPGQKGKTTLPRFSLNNIQVTDGHFIFEDRPKGMRHTVESLAFSLPFISSLPYKAQVYVEPRFSAVVDGAAVELHGRSQPFTASHASSLDLELQDLELGRLKPYWPASLPLQLKSGQLGTRLSLQFSQPPDAEPSLTVSGEMQLRGLSLTDASDQPWLGLQSLDLQLRKAEPLQGRWLFDRLVLAGLEVEHHPSKQPLSVQELSAEQILVDADARRWEAGQVLGKGVQARMLRTEEGQWQWITLPQTSSAEPSSNPPEASTSQDRVHSWAGLMARLEMQDMALRFEDRMLSPAAVQNLTHIRMQMDKVNLRPDQENTFELGATVNQSGKIQASGTFRLQPLSAQLKLVTQALPMASMQGYLAPYVNASIVQGLISSQGQLRLEAPDDTLQARYQGTLTLGQFLSLDPVNNTDFLRWKSLYFGGIDFALEPARLQIGEIALSDFYSRLILNQDGRLNLVDILRRPQLESPPSGSASSAEEKQVWPVEIAKVTLQNGRVDFSDRFVRPNYSASVSRLGGSVRHLSSAPDTLAELDLRGNYAGNAPVQITARLNPLAQKKFLDLQAEVSSVDLVDFSPYAGKYAGYKIDKGKLSLNARYKLADRQLTADNRLFIDQLTFGDKVESPDATQLPLQLAIALLKNNQGEIDIHLPIAGSLDDPQFSIGGLILKVIGNLLVKAVTSPFALLGSMFGDGQELSQIVFAPGLAHLNDEAQAKLQTLAKAMREREGLRLEITAGADLALDPEALRRAALERAVLNEKRKDLAGTQQSSASTETPPIEAAEYATYLKRAYQQARFPKPRNLLGLTKELPAEEMEKLMLASLPAGDEELRALATRRARAVQNWLVEQGQIPLSRVFLLPVQLGAAPESSGQSSRNRVDFSLR